MFAARYRRIAGRFGVDVAFTDRWGGVSSGPYASLDLTRHRPGADQELKTNRERLAAPMGVAELATMSQVHGAEVHVISDPSAEPPVGDALVTTTPGIALCVRAADCVPLVLADVSAGVVGVAHVGRPGVTAGTVSAVVDALRSQGAGDDLEAWIGPHICAACYEVPADMRADVAAVEPVAFACTTWGTPSVDIGAAVAAQLHRMGFRTVTDVERCTRESDDLFSYRRQGPASGRLGGVVVLHERSARSHTGQSSPGAAG